MLHSIPRKGRDTNITRIFPNINLLIYIITPQTSYINMFVEKNLNHVRLKFIDTFKTTAGSRITTGNNR